MKNIKYVNFSETNNIFCSCKRSKNFLNIYSHKPSISVIVPVFNAHKYIYDSVNMLNNQDFDSYEVIFVNDGSRDDSLDLLQKYTKKNSKIKIIDQKNLGAGSARNAGMQIARGEFFLFLDIDDIYSYNLLSTSYRFARKLDADIIFWKYGIENDNKIIHDYGKPKYFFNKNINYGETSFLYPDITNPAPWNKLLKRSFVNFYNIKYQEISSCNDIGFIWLCLTMGKKIFFLNKELIIYRVNGDNSISKNRGRNWINIFYACEYIVSYLKELNKFDVHRFYNSLKISLMYEYKQIKNENEKKLFKSCLNKYIPPIFLIKFD